MQSSPALDRSSSWYLLEGVGRVPKGPGDSWPSSDTMRSERAAKEFYFLGSLAGL